MVDIRSAPELLTPREAAAFLRINRGTLDRWVRLGKLPAPVKLGGAVVRHRRDALLRALEEAETAEPIEARTRRASRKPKNKTKR